MATGRRIGETSLDVGSSRFWIGGVTKQATNVPALRVGTDRPWRSQERSANGGAGCKLGDYDQLHHFIAAGGLECRAGGDSCWFKRISSSRQRCRAGDRTIPRYQDRHSFVGVAAQ